MNKRHITAIILATLLTIIQVNADATQIGDIDSSSDFAKSSIVELAKQNIIQGDSNGNFSPHKQITRAEMVTLLVKALGVGTTSLPEKATFADVPKNNWANKYVEAAYKAGIVNGADANNFEPNQVSTREQMAAMFVRALKILEPSSVVEFKNIDRLSDKNKISAWAKREVEVAIASGLMKGVSDAEFNPASYANKEQAAVVIDRLIRNKDQIISEYKDQSSNTIYVDLQFNREVVSLKNKAILENESVMVPIEFANKFVMGRNNGEHGPDGDAVKFTIDTIYNDKGINYLWFKVGDKRAFKNIPQHPFGIPDLYKDNMIELETAPVVKSGLTYLPLKDLCNILGIQYNYDLDNHKAMLDDVRIGRQPNLFYALKKLSYYIYIGKIDAQGYMEVSNKTTNFYSKSSFKQNDRMNDPYNGYLYTEYKYEESNKEPEIAKLEYILLGNKFYNKDFKDNKWVVKTIDAKPQFIAVEFYDPIYEDGVAVHKYINRDIFNNLYRLDVKNEGSVIVNGKPAVKYTIELNSHTIKNIMTDAEYEGLVDYFKDIFNNNIKYTYEFYVSDGTVIKQVYRFEGSITEPGTNSSGEMKIYVDVNYNNIGETFEIPVPK